MIEIIILFFFSKKIKEICTQKGLKNSKWQLRLYATWFIVEISSILLIIIIIGENLKEESLLVAAIPAMTLAILSGFYILRTVENLENNSDNDINLNLKEEEEEDKFKHFR